MNDVKRALMGDREAAKRMKDERCCCYVLCAEERQGYGANVTISQMSAEM